MTPNLCACCCNLPSALFQADQDEQGITGGPEIYLPPLNCMIQRATEGCELCKIWTANPNVASIPQTYLQFAPVRLRRSIIAPHMSLTAYIGFDTLFVVYFARIPLTWSKSVHDALVVHCNTNVKLKGVPTQHHDNADWLENFLIRSWLDICRSQHPECNKALKSANEGPSRLLDLQAFDNSNDIRLVECQTLVRDYQMLELPRFVCLSHCWGETTALPVMTKKATLLQHLERVSHSELSRTFQDTIRISRQLNERYLWIDSLCIVQDDPADWETEAARMPAIYGGATLTIAALGAENGSGGCYLVPKARPVKERASRA
jgi:hypothetical protein